MARWSRPPLGSRPWGTINYRSHRRPLFIVAFFPFFPSLPLPGITLFSTNIFLSFFHSLKYRLVPGTQHSLYPLSLILLRYTHLRFHYCRPVTHHGPPHTRPLPGAYTINQRPPIHPFGKYVDLIHHTPTHTTAKMVSLRLRSLSGRFSLSSSLRRTSWGSQTSATTAASSSTSTTMTGFCAAAAKEQHDDEYAASAAGAVNKSMCRVPSVAGLVQEHRDFSSELGILEPRPVVYWESMEETMGLAPIV